MFESRASHADSLAGTQETFRRNQPNKLKDIKTDKQGENREKDSRRKSKMNWLAKEKRGNKSGNTEIKR